MAKKKEVTNEMILKAVLSMDERLSNVEESIATTVATKDNLALLKEELLDEIRPIAKAVDKDAVTLMAHERRITKIEKQLSVA